MATDKSNRERASRDKRKTLNCTECGVPLKSAKKKVDLAIPGISTDSLKGRGHKLSPQLRLAKYNQVLSLYSELGTIGACLKAAKVDYRTYLRWKEDPEFVFMLNEAQQQFNSKIEMEMLRRAVDGVDEPVVSAGRYLGTKKKYSDDLIKVIARAHQPEKYADGRKGIGAELSKNEDGTVTMKVYQGFNPDDV